MPIFEGYCNNPSCDRHQRKVEMLLRRWDDPNKPCPKCKQLVNRLVGKPSVIWAKPLGWYDGNSGEGHMVCGQYPDGTKYNKMITTRQEQLEHCRMNGLADPLEISRHGALDDRGKEEAGQVFTWGSTPPCMAASVSVQDDNWI